MDNRTKEILCQVSYKGQIEREKHNKRLSREEFEKEIWEDYKTLERLIEKAINPYVGNSELDNAQKYIDSSTFDENQRVELESFLNDKLKWEEYWKLLAKAKANQLSALDNPGSAKKKDLHKELDKKEAREK